MLKTAKVRDHAKFCGDWLNRCWDMTIFIFLQDGGRPPSWICDERIWTTHEEHLVVFIIVQNLVGIDAVVFIICMFFDFTSLVAKCLFTPPKLGFLGIWPLNGEAYERNPQKAHLWAERCHMTYRSSKSVHRFDLCAWRRDQKKRKTKTETRQWQTGYSPRPPTSSCRNEILHGPCPVSERLAKQKFSTWGFPINLNVAEIFFA